ncbi:hypothetical protein D3C85_1305890 [compost metagenome]
MPFVAVFAAHAVQVGTGALRAPLEGVVVDEFAGHRIVAIAQRLRVEGADHLRVAVVATFAQVDVAAHELHRGVGPDALHRFGGRLLVEQRHDFGQAANGDDHQRQHDQPEVAGFDLLVAETAGFFDLLGHVALLRRATGSRRESPP